MASTCLQRWLKVAIFALTLLMLIAPARAVGFQHVTAPDPEDQPLEVGIWYPSDALASQQPIGFFSQTVAVDGPVAGTGLPLILISHGNGGSLAAHHDTAPALAKVGFVVAAVTHTGDNNRDQSKMAQMVDRPRHVSRMLDYMLAAWPDHNPLDPLALIGGVPDMSRVGPYCADHPQDFGCRVTRDRYIVVPPPPPASAWIHDSRIEAAVVAAPALAFTFIPDGLSAVSVPVQLWRPADDEILPNPNYAQAVDEAMPTKSRLSCCAERRAFRIHSVVRLGASAKSAGSLSGCAKF
jgi:predicted dienelactone hydrolase